jgi:hypothetical protein
MPVKTVIKHRNSAASVWTSTNPTLAVGEMGVESDTLKSKIGDGTTAWNSLAYTKAGAADSAAKASKITASSLDRTVFVSSTTPSGAVTGDIWIQV